MGNCLPCVCYDSNDEAITTTAGAAKSSAKKTKTACRAAARHVVPVDTPEEGDDGGETEGIKQMAWSGCHVEPVVGDDGGVRVKIVMKRKEVEELVARLEQRDAAERKARMEELSNELGGGGGVVAVTMMSPCRDAWQPQLASIPENY
ncbi:hypothetical protein PR202_ga05908 [Eleusine coracana subsp. coracana]|uniref:Uncharacterized protein n=1 Tax=Eleusine coracana subsp. coracana TaxID=191504 RepID=A0AAV5BUQ3_ELECO|nr:hypothetical protein QOZ80_5AG0363850 [Eleusine coracana subsp. coracana]GJM89696.1 hypothetical protein PR202_ga05908 [Eleusine coracana subsp. coracana]